ncbi:MAG TPA: VWA domain-containing protein, partial [Symbiobacteriaceae bacterium]|nr:VWA domain-containing protein [Symbiobacteriaceae bacterium]
ASSSSAPWAGLADRVAFLVGPVPPVWEPSPRPIGLAAAVELIAAAAALWGVSGHRAEAYCLRTALAIARATGRRRLQLGDIHEAIALVLAPRARVTPAPPPPREDSQHASSRQGEAPAPPLTVSVPPLPTAPAQVREALHGPTARSVPGRRRRGTLNLSATLLAALPWQRLRSAAPPPLAIRPADLRWHLHRPRVGRLVIFLVDSSGSMGAHRLGQAKGAVLRYLQESYRRRDHVALIAAGGAAPRLLLPPARAVEQARRNLVSLPAGGGTPLSGALLLAHRLSVEAKRREDRSSLLVAMTDGRANQPLPGGSRATVREELMRCCLLLRRSGAAALVLGEPGPEARELCRWMGAPLLSLYSVTALTGKAAW